jgi:hypothetical protein
VRKENGVYTRRFIARNEIEKEWEKVSLFREGRWHNY